MRMLLSGLAFHESGGRGLLPAGLVDEIRVLDHPPLPWDAQLARWFEEFVPSVEKRRMIDIFRNSCDSPVIAVPSIGDDQESDGADYHVEADPELLLECIADVISKKSAARNGAA